MLAHGIFWLLALGYCDAEIEEAREKTGTHFPISLFKKKANILCVTCLFRRTGHQLNSMQNVSWRPFRRLDLTMFWDLFQD